MAHITRYPFARHVRSEPSRHLLHFRRGRLVRAGRGLAFWFWPPITGLVEVPCDDRDVPFLFHGRALDFQDVVTQGTITYRVADPELLAARVDFSIELGTGLHREAPLEQIAAILTHRSQKLADGYVTRNDVRTVLAEGVRRIRERLEAGFAADAELEGLGLEIVGVHVASVSPSSELEKALQNPMREAIQQESDEATFRRRALAVEKERAIEENELQSRIELARRERALIEQHGENARRRVTEEAEAGRITVAGEAERRGMEARASADADRVLAEVAAERMRLVSRAEAEGIEAIQTATVEAERARMDIYRDLPAGVLVGLAAQEFAGKLNTIERIHIAPESIGPVLSELVTAGSRLLKDRTAAGTGE